MSERPDLQAKLHRLHLVRGTIDRQRAYIARVPDPDNRSQAETNLQTLVVMREALESEMDHALQPQDF